ncbi:hypothetical protein [Paenibacillus koleovorans]|uniref:hypothetical protein n=1 Tax=Paenibacillus koleovorans TaxID=121608 RepID=UPI000FDAB1B1|nr:hypothetical protein [Paenibacillus koleovorans]
MLKNRTFIIGLGIGLIAGAVLLQLLWIADPERNEATAEQTGLPMTQQQLALEAERLQLKVVPKDQIAYTTAQIEEIKRRAIEDDKAKSAATTPSPTSSNAASSTSTPVPTVQPTALMVYIPDKLDATSVAHLLVQYKVLQEPNALIDLLLQRGLTEKIRYGNYTFDKLNDAEDVMKKITAGP